MAEIVSWQFRAGYSRPDNGRTKQDRATYRARNKELNALALSRPEIMPLISKYRDEWMRNNNLASFPTFCDWLKTTAA